MKPYYYVRQRGSSLGAKIEDKVKAIDNAESRALSYPGATFEVLKVIAIARVPDSITFYVDGEGPED